MDGRLETWFRGQRAVTAPDGILRAVAERTRSTRQRRGPLGLVTVLRDLADGRPRSSVATRIGLVAVVGAVVAAGVLVSPARQPDVRPGLVAGSPSASPASSSLPSATKAPTATGTAAPTPSLAPGMLRIDFQVVGGMYCMAQSILNGCDPVGPSASASIQLEGHLVGHGSFTMTGAFTAAGSFSDAITYTPDGVFTVTRTLETDRGQLDAEATVTTFNSATNTMTTSGTWRIVGGTGAWTMVAASGTLSGATSRGSTSKAPTETWLGRVSQ